MTPENQHTTSDGIRLVYRLFTPSAPPRSVVVLVHGYADHCGRYTHLTTHLTAHGHAVFAYDQRGHGRSGGRRAYVSSFDVVLDDLSVMLEVVRRAIPEAPLFLLGHSMGGAVVTLYSLERRPGVDGLILSSPALRLPAVAPVLQRFSSLIGRLVPRLPTVKLDLCHLSRDPDVVARAQTDPLYYRGRMPARTGAALIQAIGRINRRMEALTAPFLLIHGIQDRITDPDGSADLYLRAGSRDKTLVLYPDFYHETFNEPEKDRVLELMAEWLDEHV